MTQKRWRLVALLGAALLVALLLGVWALGAPGAAAGTKSITVTVAHLDGTQRQFSLDTQEAYLGPALEQAGLISGSQQEFGLFIEAVDGETADSGKKQWWTFTVNGEYGSYGADTQPLADGDVYAFSIYTG